MGIVTATEREVDSQRRLGLLGATGIGVGAIVGGGILALAGAAFATTGPAAIVAFGLNGAVAILTAPLPS
jgi:APA family basic amino acid/polyamine antiporter